MNKAERYKNIMESKKTTLTNWLYYFYMLCVLKKDALKGYTGRYWYTKLNPWIINRLKEKDGFGVIEECKTEKGTEYTVINWAEDEEDKEEEANTN